MTKEQELWIYEWMLKALDLIQYKGSDVKVFRNVLVNIISELKGEDHGKN